MRTLVWMMLLSLAACSSPGGDQTGIADLSGGTGDLAAFTGVSDEIVLAFDGQVSTVGLETNLHSAEYLRGRGGLYLSGGRYWFAEGTTSCGGNWGVRTVSFQPGAGGSVASKSQVCESTVGLPVTTHLVSKETKGLCYVTHAPDLDVRCGRLLDQPGTYKETAPIGGPGEMLLTGFAGSFALLYQNLTSGSLSLRRFDSLMAPQGEVLLGAGSMETQSMAGVQVGGDLWMVHGPNKGPLDLVRVRADWGMSMPQRLPVVGSAAGTVPVDLEAVAQDGTMNLAIVVDTDLYLGVLYEGGEMGFRRVFASTASGGPSNNTLLNAKIATHGGERLVLVSDPGPQPHIYLLRLDSAARLLERPLAISNRAGAPWGAALDETGSGLWVVYTAKTGNETYDVLTQRISLPGAPSPAFR